MDKNDDAIAIIGIAGRFPGASSPHELWQLCDLGVEAITRFEDDDLRSNGIPEEAIQDPNYVKASPILPEHPGLFDAPFFGLTPREAEYTDPQHRLMLQVSWEALEDAGCAGNLDGITGVFCGAAMNTYLVYSGVAQSLATEYLPVLIGNDNSFLATRISYKLNLTGPSLTVQTACSTSLVAVHLACQSLLNDECDTALAGGVSVRVPHTAGYYYHEGSVASPDGHCRPFDASAQGTLFGSGAGMVLLRRLDDALDADDHIYATIQGTAVNNDGSSKTDYTAPSVGSQSDVIAQAIEAANVSPRTIGYVEAHGTGTYLGDPIEVAALTKAFREHTEDRQFCAIGSIKGNIGHLDAAAGVAGLLRAALALHHKKLPATLNYSTPNPQINFPDTPFFVTPRSLEWHSEPTIPRRASVTSLGIGGTNAHVILEEAPHRSHGALGARPQLLVFSAKTKSSLDKITTRMAEHIRHDNTQALPDIAYTLQVGRKHFKHRRMGVVSNPEDIFDTLKNVHGDHKASESSQPIAFMFPGGGAQHHQMGIGLYEHEPIFREKIQECFAVVREEADLDLSDIVYSRSEPGKALEKPSIALPALFSVELALTHQLMAWGIRPSALIGHSLGEYTAACIAGMLSLKDALSIVLRRGHLFEKLPRGGMLSVPLGEGEITPFLSRNVAIAAINRPNQCVLSGPAEELQRIQDQLAGKEIDSTRVPIAVAAHSPMVEPIISDFHSFISTIEIKEARIPVLSNLTGRLLERGEATDPNYWTDHLRKTVRFADGLANLMGEQEYTLVEVGPGQTLSSFARNHPKRGPTQLVVSAMRHQQEDITDVAAILRCVGQLWLTGSEINWTLLEPTASVHRVPIPTYAFDHELFWKQEKCSAPIQAQTDPGATTRQTRIPNNKHEEAPSPPEEPNEPAVGERTVQILAALTGIGKSDIQPTSTFLGLGLDSLALTQLTSKLKKEFGISIEARELLSDANTPERLTAYITKTLPNNTLSEKTSASEPAVTEPTRVDTVTTRSCIATPDTRAKIVDEIKKVTGTQMQGQDHETNLLSLGVSSLDLTLILSSTNRKFGTKITLRGFLDSGCTVSALAAIVGAAAPTRKPDTDRKDPDHIAPDPPVTFLRPAWSRVPPSEKTANVGSTGKWLILADESEVGRELCRQLLSAQQEAILAENKPTLERKSANLYSYPLLEDTYDQLIGDMRADGDSPRNIVHLLSLSDGNADRKVWWHSSENQKRSLHSIIWLAQALGKHGIEPVRLTLITDNLFRIRDTDSVAPGKATILGPTRVLPKEYKNLHVKLVDVESASDLQTRAKDVLDALSIPETDGVFAYRNGDVYEQGLEEISVHSTKPQPASTSQHHRGPYLITGGLSGAGFQLARHIAADTGAPLCLVGRTRIPPREQWSGAHSDDPDTGERIARITELESLGSPVLALQADVGNLAQLEQALLTARRRFGHINTAIHAAGILHDGLVQHKKQATTDAALHAKLRGSANLIELLNRERCENIILMSSAHSFTAPAGQIDHVAANSVLNAIADSHGSLTNALCVSAIAWPVWRDAGQLSGRERTADEEEIHQLGITSKQALEAFEALQKSDMSGTIVIKNQNTTTPQQDDVSITDNCVFYERTPPPRKYTSSDNSEDDLEIIEAKTPQLNEMIDLLIEGFPKTSRQSWIDFFSYDWLVQKPRFGYIARLKGQPVGTIATVYAKRKINGSTHTFCSVSSWYVKPKHRQASLSLMLAALDQGKEVNVTGLTPNTVGQAILQSEGYDTLDTHKLVFPPLPNPKTMFKRKENFSFVSGAEHIQDQITQTQQHIVTDHKRQATGIYLIKDGSDQCLLLTKQRLVRGLIPMSELLHCSNTTLLQKYFSRIKFHILLRDRSIALLGHSRLFGRPTDFAIRYKRPAYFRSASLEPKDIDNLYSEIALLSV